MQHSDGIVFFLGLLFFVMSACSSQKPDPQIPAKQPDITGRITQLTVHDKLRILVETDPADSTTTPKASIVLPVEAHIVRRSGGTIERETLKEGDSVSVWFDGPVLMSYPMQAGAKIVVLEK